MIEFISIFTQQLEEAMSIGANAKLKKTQKQIDNILICGLGGSGIGGKIASQLIENYSKIPVLTHSNYGVPNFVNENTLVIISSYSGNTEETVSAMKEAHKRKAEISCITSGGKVADFAKENSLNHVIVPGGNPPRAMLTYSLTQLFFTLHNYGFIFDDFKPNLQSAVELLNQETEFIKKEAQKAVDVLKNKTILIYTDDTYGGVGTRFKQQLNENSKTLGYSNVIPEMNHNELLGWNGGSNNFGVIFLRNESDNERNQYRMNISKEIISSKTNSVVEIYSKGNSEIEKTLYLILFTDWISYYLAEEYQVDSIEIEVIDKLKKALSEK